MGHGYSKNKFELEKIIKEVKDLRSYIRKNSDDFDDQCRENLHTRLIEYSQALQDIFASVDKRTSKECKDATKLIGNVINELYQQRPLDTGAVDTDSFIHVTGKDAKLWSPNQSVSKDKKQTRIKNGVIPQNKYSVPSLEDIKCKTDSLKRNIDNYIRNDDINQLIVQQKILQILATDIEMLSYEEHTPLQETKKGLEKDLSLMYRKIERTKRKHSDATQSRQKELRESISKLTHINTRLDQIMSRDHALVRSEKLSGLSDVRDDIVDMQQKISSITIKNEEVSRIKSEIGEKMSKILPYLNTVSTTLTGLSQENNREELDDTSKQLTAIKNISLNADHCMNQAKLLFKEDSREDLLKLKDELLKNRSILRKYKNCDKSVTLAQSETEEKIKNVLRYLENCIERTYTDKKSVITKANLEKAYNLIDDCREDIMKFDENTCQSDYNTYKKHLGGLESFLGKIVTSDTSIMKRKDECVKNLLDCYKILKDKSEHYLQKDENTKRVSDPSAVNNVDNVKLLKKVDTTQGLKVGQCDTSLDDGEIVELRKRNKTSKCDETKTVDGFYIYWRELQSNLPSYNCTLSELKQIALLLNDIESQIRQKRVHIESFLRDKQKPGFFVTSNNPDETKIIDEANPNMVKTNAKIFKLNETKQITDGDDEEIIQSVDEIKENAKQILKQRPEQVILSSDSSVSDSVISESMDKVDKSHPYKSMEDKANIISGQDKATNNFKKLNNKDHIEHISQVQNIACSVQYLKEKALRFIGSKQSPQYADMKSKLDSYRRTLSILISYQNENITLSCNRVIATIDEVVEILNTNTEQSVFKFPQSTNINKTTIENVFKEIIEIKSRVEDIAKTIESFQETEENEIYQSICDELLNNRKILGEMKINPNYEVILNSKFEVFRQIDDNLYKLDIKLQENRVKQRQVISKTSEEQQIVNQLHKMKDKVERFSGTYQNVLYKEIERGIAACLNSAEHVCKNKQLIEHLREDAKIYLKILEEKATKENSDSSQGGEKNAKYKFEDNSKGIVKDIPVDIAVQLSQIRQRYKEINDIAHASKALTDEAGNKLKQTIDAEIAQLNSLNLKPTEPFYLDTENLKQDFLRLSTFIKESSIILHGHRTPADGESISQTPTLKSTKNDIENPLNSIEENLEYIKTKIEHFANEKSSSDFFNIDEALTRLSMNIDKIYVTKGTDLHKKKTSILKNIYACCDKLESQAQNYEMLQNVDKKIEEVKYRLENFHDLSNGDYNALHKELTDLDVTLRELTISGKLAEEMLRCQTNIHECLATIERKYISQDVRDSDSDGGTSV